jgi:hypothetical protein
MDLNLSNLVQDRIQWQALVNTIIKTMQLFDQLSDYQLLRKDINSYIFTVANIYIVRYV